jgi:hypothetical protein
MFLFRNILKYIKIIFLLLFKFYFSYQHIKIIKKYKKNYLKKNQNTEPPDRTMQRKQKRQHVYLLVLWEESTEV